MKAKKWTPYPAVVQWKKAISRNEKTKQTEKLGELLKIQIDTEKL